MNLIGLLISVMQVGQYSTTTARLSNGVPTPSMQQTEALHRSWLSVNPKPMPASYSCLPFGAKATDILVVTIRRYKEK